VLLGWQGAPRLSDVEQRCRRRPVAAAAAALALAATPVAGPGRLLHIGVLLGYAPGVDPDEYLRVAGLAADAGVSTFTHARDLIEMVPQAAIDGAEEIGRAAGQAGAHMHYCHVNSTSQRHIERVLGLVGGAQAAGARISTEAYPYGSGMTAPSSTHRWTTPRHSAFPQADTPRAPRGASSMTTLTEQQSAQSKPLEAGIRLSSNTTKQYKTNSSQMTRICVQITNRTTAAPGGSARRRRNTRSRSALHCPSGTNPLTIKRGS
jgi:hypothetical protein